MNSDLYSELVEKGGEVDESEKVAEDHLTCKMAPRFKRLTFELRLTVTPTAAGVLREAEGRHTETDESIFNKLTPLKLLAVETKDAVDGVF